MANIRVYGSPFCPGIAPVLAMLKQAQVEYEYLDIAVDSAARERLREINQGYESVPTLEFPDGSTLTEPGAGELRKKLQALGYHVPFTALLAGNAWSIFVIVAVIIALLRAFGVF